jgi:hypothetical protein
VCDKPNSSTSINSAATAASLSSGGAVVGYRKIQTIHTHALLGPKLGPLAPFFNSLLARGSLIQ